MISLPFMLALLTVSDPVAGPSAASVLLAPSSAMYRNLAPFDLREVVVLDSGTLELQLELGGYANPLGLDNGFSHPIIEIYVGGGEYGVRELLPGSGMQLPDAESWSVAFQLTGDYARGWYATDTGTVEFEPELQLIDDHLFVMSELPRIENPRVAAQTGLYSPFHTSGWRPLETEVSAWAFSSPDQQFPVVDVLALDEAAQLSALTGGILPVTEVNTIENPNTLWFALMAGGIALAGIGLVLRGFGRTPVQQTPAVADSDTEAEPEPETPAAELTAARLSALVAADRGSAAEDGPDSAAEPAVDDSLPAGETDADESEEAVVPRVGVFRGQDLDTHDGDPDSGDGDFALPELASVDFGEFETLEDDPVAEADEDEDGSAVS